MRAGVTSVEVDVQLVLCRRRTSLYAVIDLHLVSPRSQDRTDAAAYLLEAYN